MGQKIASNSNFENGGACAVGATTTNSETQVILNVYDLTPFNHYTVWFGFGIFHSGIEGEPAGFPSLETVHALEEKEEARSVIDGRYTCTSINYQSLTDTFCLFHGMEYGFGAHDFPISGVFEVEPKTCPGFIFRRSIPLGRINMPPSEFRTFVETMASEYHGNTYHLISKNCNHFTDDIAWRLTGKHIPGWVNRLARMGALCSCLLPESLQVTTVKQLPEYHTCTESCVEDGTESLSTATHESAAESDESEKVLLSPSAGNSDVTFIKEIHR